MKAEELLQHMALALRFDEEDGLSPKVQAKARGLLAEELIRVAKENEIPIVEDESLLRGLSFLETGQKVPEAFFPLLAELVVHVESLCQSLQEKTK
jgi:flagellar biosynthesis protein